MTYDPFTFSPGLAAFFFAIIRLFLAFLAKYKQAQSHCGGLKRKVVDRIRETTLGVQRLEYVSIHKTELGLAFLQIEKQL